MKRIFVLLMSLGLVVGASAQRGHFAGGGGFYRAMGLERLFRDIQGVRYHRPQERMQHRYSGELALCREPGN